MACVWGFVGLLEGTGLICPDSDLANAYPEYDFKDQAYYFQDTSGFNPYQPQDWIGTSWVVRFAYTRTAETTTNPCDVGTVYVASMYWAVMTMTSIGYGDILPQTTVEYVVCTLCMMAASIQWAYILGAACAVMSNNDPELSEFERKLDAFNSMANAQKLPSEIRQRGRAYIREARIHSRYLRNQAAWDGLGSDLKGAVARQIAHQYIDKIWYFKNTDVEFREEAANKFRPHFYEQREIVEHPSKLCVVERGAVGRKGRILVPWSFWGDDMLLRIAILREDWHAITLSYSQLMTLSRDDLTDVLLRYPEEAVRFRRAAAKMALLSASRIFARLQRSGDSQIFEGSDYRWVSDIFRAAKDCTRVDTPKDVSLYAAIAEVADGENIMGVPIPGMDSRLAAMEKQLLLVLEFVQQFRDSPSEQTVSPVSPGFGSRSPALSSRHPHDERMLHVMQQLNRIEKRFDNLSCGFEGPEAAAVELEAPITGSHSRV